MKKFHIDQTKDYIVDLLDDAAIAEDPGLVDLLLGFQPDLATSGQKIMESYFRSLAFDLERILYSHDPTKTISCIEKLASASARWQPDRYH